MNQALIERDLSTYSRLENLSFRLRQCSTKQDRSILLDQDEVVSDVLSHKSNQPLRDFILGLSLEQAIVIKSLIAIDQLERIIGKESITSQLYSLIADLLPVEEFYEELGGIVGYQTMILQTIRFPEQSSMKAASGRCMYHPPIGIDIAGDTQAMRQCVIDGIRSLPVIAEIYPVGGAADRLRLYDPITHIPLPAAKLSFLGKTLIEGLIVDLQSREYLYYKLFHRQVTVPVVMMTSEEKDNHVQILSICQQLNWFHRPLSAFSFFSQAGVPMIDRQGDWCVVSPGKLLLKPGGHGVIWKMARDAGVLNRLVDTGHTKLLVRQINNPIAGCDRGLLAFSGIGCAQDKAFGFASCLRQVKSAEGVNVLMETQEQGRRRFCLTNIEYCDFHRFGIEDSPVEPASVYSLFPSNTNILFADIAAVLDAISTCPVPGLIVNFKKIVHQNKEEELARLESTMQNIADCFVCEDSLNHSKTFLTYNERRKTISTIKREFQLGSSLLETPEGCYLDYLENARELLTGYCRFAVADLFHFVYHPALGPLYTIIAQKICGGELKQGSELQLDIAEVRLRNLMVDGSLSLRAENIMGHVDESGVLIYSEHVGRCILNNVTVRNRGINRELSNCLWRNEIIRYEQCEILLYGDSEFYAENIVLEGNVRIEVAPGFRVIASMQRGRVAFDKEPLEGSLWHWKYEIAQDASIELSQEG